MYLFWKKMIFDQFPYELCRGDDIHGVFGEMFIPFHSIKRAKSYWNNPYLYN